MIARYPHAPECPKMRPTISHWDCTCGATAQQSAFDAGKREADARAMAARDRALTAAIDLVRANPEHPDIVIALLMAMRDTKEGDGERRG